MAKMTVKVDNGLDEIKLQSTENLEPKKKDKKVEKKPKSEKKNKKSGRLKQVAEEMKLVTWPTRKNVLKYSIATIVMIILLALFFVALSALFDLLYGLVQGWIG